MAGSVNKVILIGNLGTDPEIRNMQSGAKVANLSLATTESWKDQSGQRQDRTEWHRVVVFGDGLINVIEQYVKKGMKVYVEGQLRTRKWQDQQGQDRYSTEVVISGFGGTLTMLSPQNQSGGGYGNDGYGNDAGGYPQNQGYTQPQPDGTDTPAPSQPEGMGGISDLDDDIPF